MCPKRQISSAAAQVTTNRPTIMNPAVLMSKPAMYLQNGPFRCSSMGSRPSTSMVPIRKQIATDSPVMARL